MKKSNKNVMIATTAIFVIAIVIMIVVFLDKEKTSGPQKAVETVKPKERQVDKTNTNPPSQSPPPKAMLKPPGLDVPPLEQRMAEYKELGILDVECGLTSNCQPGGRAGAAAEYSIASLLTRKKMPIGDFGTKAKKNESMMACSYGPQDGNPRDSGLMFVQYWGYKSRGEWCSRLAQMYCDLGPKGRLNKKHIYEPFNGVEYYRKTAASIIQVEGYATCVDEDLLNMAKNQE